MLYRGPWTQYAEIWVAAAGLLRLLVGCLYPPTPPTHPLTVTVTDQLQRLCRPPAQSTLSRPCVGQAATTATGRPGITLPCCGEIVSTKLECRADPRSEWLNRLKRRLSSGSVVTRGFESRSDIFGLQTVLVELRYRQHFTGRGGEGSWSRPSNFLH